MSNDPDDPIARGDIDAVLRRLDQLVDHQSWDDIERLRQRCLVSFERGHQLWPAAGAAAHRLALRAPAPYAARVCADPEPPFRIGPLSEVVASTHTWAELHDYLEAGPTKAAIAHERIVRGDQIAGEAGDVDPVFGLPTVLSAWEPNYVVAEYDDFGFDAPSPTRPPTEPWHLEGLDRSRRRDTDEVTDALLSCVATWVTRSTGRAEVVAIEGRAEQAIAGLGISQVHAGDVDAAEFSRHVAWAAASGGAQGPRRGMAAARLDLWWLMACATNLHEDWPVDPDDLADALESMRFVFWHPGHQPTGWELHVAIEDPVDGLAWALAAADAD